MRRFPKYLLAWTGTLFLVTVGCQQEMAVQPSYRAFEPSTFFPDLRSARPTLPGTVARGQLKADVSYYTGQGSKMAWNWKNSIGMIGAPLSTMMTQTVMGGLAPPYAQEIPVSADKLEMLLLRGKQRYDVFCSVCHDLSGTGHGMIVERGFTPPPNLHTDLSRKFKLMGYEVPLKDAPVGYYYEVITHGYGAMPDYAGQIPPADRWAIIAYIRALQFSQSAPLEEVRDPAARQALLKKKGNER